MANPTTNYEATVRTKEYMVWAAMRQRCLNPSHFAYARYGGRGISICERWGSYLNFLADMGRKPPGTSLERLDNSKGYSPENCAWVTRKAQQRNRRNTLKVTYQGETLPLAELAERHGRKYHLIWDRVFRQGWPLERALHA